MEYVNKMTYQKSEMNREKKDETKNEIQNQTAQIIVRTMAYVKVLPMMLIFKLFLIFVCYLSSAYAWKTDFLFADFVFCVQTFAKRGKHDEYRNGIQILILDQSLIVRSAFFVVQKCRFSAHMHRVHLSLTAFLMISFRSYVGSCVVSIESHTEYGILHTVYGIGIRHKHTVYNANKIYTEPTVG